jgi:adenylate kinase family enzyme
MKKAITIMGLAGSGKSTVARLVAESLGWHCCSTGEIARSLIAGDWQELGTMAPEAQMREAFEADIAGHDLVVLDGMPRKPEQVGYLDGLFDEVTYYVLVITTTQAVSRLLNRDRGDDTHNPMIQRISDYRDITEGAIAEARRHHLVRRLNGTLPVDGIAGMIVQWHK